ncbi:hypothetical protein [Nannocystis exedens]|uniref:hypothetical protein n=1 Tax=Nannocystis exedens TaxID=54 RepID=UPI000BBA0328|nr:hypothetical protein [Nannocystis exedens]
MKAGDPLCRVRRGHTNVSDGWHDDDEQNPTDIFVCPQTCAEIQGVHDAEIHIEFGCETIIAQW